MTGVELAGWVLAGLVCLSLGVFLIYSRRNSERDNEKEAAK